MLCSHASLVEGSEKSMKEVPLELLLREFEKLIGRWGSTPIIMNSIRAKKEKSDSVSHLDNG